MHIIGDGDYAAFEVITEPEEYASYEVITRPEVTTAPAGYASYELTLELEADYASLQMTFALDPDLGEAYELLRLPQPVAQDAFSAEDEAFFNSEINTNVLLEDAEETAVDRAQIALFRFVQRARTLVSHSSPTINRA